MSAVCWVYNTHNITWWPVDLKWFKIWYSVFKIMTIYDKEILYPKLSKYESIKYHKWTFSPYLKFKIKLKSKMKMIPYSMLNIFVNICVSHERNSYMCQMTNQTIDNFNDYTINQIENFICFLHKLNDDKLMITNYWIVWILFLRTVSFRDVFNLHFCSAHLCCF